ncbi:ATP-binding cassette domain-containing protein [bacterium]|nr:ATP-binding cassette domain-containing protein [bacterium]
MITVTDLTFAYPGQSPVLNSIGFSILPGTHVAVLGPNGSGKSTLALILKGLLRPSSGTVTVDGFSPDSESSRFEIMKRVGLVFQNPDNTIVATTVERELAFGLENMGVPPDEMARRVDEALTKFDLVHYRHANPSNLSGGEKQRCALAAVMVMEPAHLILDEPTSLLDPWNRARLLRTIHETAAGGSTVIHITPFFEEALSADRVIILDESGICMDGSPGEARGLAGRFRTCSLCGMHGEAQEGFSENGGSVLPGGTTERRPEDRSSRTIMSLQSITYTYDRGSPSESTALHGITMNLPAGTATVLLGPSGSGKSTLLEIAAGVIAPTGGSVCPDGNPLRAMAFQFPEDQMFGDTVGSYVAFGPRNTGIAEEELPAVVDRALESVGLDPSIYGSRDPEFLSGGEKRRAALAGVLAMNPDVLVLDEPIAGLDRCGMEQVTEFLRGYIDSGGTLLFSTHDFETAWCLADYAAVLCKGRIETAGPLERVFSESEWLKRLESGPESNK